MGGQPLKPADITLRVAIGIKDMGSQTVSVIAAAAAMPVSGIIRDPGFGKVVLVSAPGLQYATAKGTHLILCFCSFRTGNMVSTIFFISGPLPFRKIRCSGTGGSQGDLIPRGRTPICIQRCGDVRCPRDTK